MVQALQHGRAEDGEAAGDRPILVASGGPPRRRRSAVAAAAAAVAAAVVAAESPVGLCLRFGRAIAAGGEGVTEAAAGAGERRLRMLMVLRATWTRPGGIIHDAGAQVRLSRPLPSPK